MLRTLAARTLAALLAMMLALAGCSSESGLYDSLPPVPDGQASELRNVSHTDVIVQASPPVVDVLWLIDNSCSMSCIVSCHSGTITDNVTENFPLFMQHFKGSGIDYHIGVITTDMDNPQDQGRLEEGLGHRWIDRSVRNDVPAFTAMATQGTSGSGTEKGISAVFNSYEEHGDQYNAGFWRDGSTIHTIVLANEPDRSSMPIDEFTNWYSELRTPDRRTFNSIVCTEGRTSACPEQNGNDYMAVSRQVGGIVWNIEDERWGVLLNSLGAQSAGLSSEYYLTQIPVEGTVEVEVDDTATGNRLEFEEVEEESKEVGFVYSRSRNSILFVNYLPEAASTVRITYDLASVSQVDTELEVPEEGEG